MTGRPNYKLKGVGMQQRLIFGLPSGEQYFC